MLVWDSGVLRKKMIAFNLVQSFIQMNDMIRHCISLPLT